MIFYHVACILDIGEYFLLNDSVKRSVELFLSSLGQIRN
jgi:hypothetical protein